jgi:hypothetical protein
LWQEWHSWLALVGLVIPLGALLTVVSRRTADGNAIYLWLYANNWTWTYITNVGFRNDFFGHGTGIVISWIEVICWSWTGGLLLGYVSRRATWSNAVLLSFGLLMGALLHPPRSLNLFSFHLTLIASAQTPPAPSMRGYFIVSFFRSSCSTSLFCCRHCSECVRVSERPLSPFRSGLSCGPPWSRV